MRNKSLPILLILILMTMSECSNSKDKLLGDDIRLFRNSKAWDLANAIITEDVNMIEKIVKHDTSLLDFQESKYGQTLLEWAVFTDKYHSVKKLAELGADPNVQSNDGTTAFILAAGKHTTSDYLKLLLRYGGDVNTISKLRNLHPTPLIAAASTNIENVRILVEAGADINFVDSEYRSAIETAASFKKVDILKYLIIEKGADISRPVGYRIDKTPYYITDLLRGMPFKLDSREYKTKMEIVDYLKTKGMDYWKAEIPPHFYEIYDSLYLERY